MIDNSYLIIHTDHPLDVEGVNAGAEMATLSLARFLARAGKRVCVAACLKNTVEGVYGGVEFWDLGPSYAVGDALKRAHERGFYHLISSGKAQAILESRTDERCCSRVLVCHDRTGSDNGLQAKTLSACVDRIICVSNAQRDVFIKAGAPADKAIVIHNGVDLELFKAGDSDKRNYRKLVFAGALIVDKGIHYLIPAFGELRKHYPDLTLDVYGTAALWGRDKLFDEREIEAQHPGIKFHGNVSQAKLSEAYATAGICVIPSIWFDPFPLTALEAQVTGCPVVAFDVGGLREGLRHEETGLVIGDIKPEALVVALHGLLSTPERLKQMSRKALETARPYFTWERVAQDVIKIIDETWKTARGLTSSGSVGVISTWNQECGLATYAGYLLKEFPTGSYTVFAEKVNSLRRPTDDPFVIRCWKRGESDFSALEAAIKQEQIGLLLINCHARFFPQPAFGQLLSRLRAGGVKVVALLHSTFTFDPQLQSLITSVDQVLVHTAENRLEAIANGARAEQVTVIPHGVASRKVPTPQEKEALRKEIGISTQEKAIVSFGFVQPHKGMHGVLEGVSHLLKRGIPARGYILGSPMADDPNSNSYLSQLHELAGRLGISDKIEFQTDFLDEAKVEKYLKAADVVLMNYQSQHYEASGACSIAIGSGAIVATSIAPQFNPFGDAVWHISAGYPVATSIELLATRDDIRSEIGTRAAMYASANSWEQISYRLQEVFIHLGFLPAVTRKEKVVSQESKPTTTSANGLRVLMQNRPTTFTKRGGDTVVIEKTIAGLESRGVHVTLDLDAKEDPSNYDVVHLFNFVLPEYVKALGERAVRAGVPFVVTTLSEDLPAFHNQSHAIANVMVDYVNGGQNSAWLQQNWPDLRTIPAADRPDNSWTSKNAAALLTNGASESDQLRAVYGPNIAISEVKLGHEVGAAGDAEAFSREYGVRDFVLCVGRLESRKNQLMLLKALEDSDLPVVFAAGEFTYQPDYAQAVRNFKRKGKTIVLGWISPEMLAGAYRACRIHALPSWYELPGLVSLEAAQGGKNVVVSRNGTAIDYLGSQAFACDPADADSIRNAVIAAYYSPCATEIKQMASSYQWDETAKQTLAVYEKVTGMKQIQEQQQQQPNAPVFAGSTGDAVSVPTLGAGGYDLAGGITEFQEILERGELAARRKEYNVAHELLARAESIDSRSVRTLRARGAVFLAEENLERAREFLGRAYQIDTNDPKTLSGLGMVEMKSRNAQGAYPLFVRALDRDPSHLVTILQLLECSYVLDRFDDLVRVLIAYTESHKDDVEMRYCLAGAYYKQGNFERATTLTETILQVHPEHLGCKQLKEIMADESKQPSVVQAEAPQAAAPAKAAMPLSKAVEVIDQSSEAAMTEAEEFKRAKKFDEAIGVIEEVLAKPGLSKGQRERALLIKAESTVLLGNFDPAQALYDEVLAANPVSARALCGKGALAANQNRWEDAQRIFGQANAIDPTYDVALAGLGLCASRSDNRDRAWVYYTEALRCNPENIRALLGLIEVGYPTKRFAEVERAVEKYLEMHPADLSFVYSLAGCYFAQDKLEDAQREIEKIMLFEPGHAKAQELKEMIDQRRQGQVGAVGR